MCKILIKYRFANKGRVRRLRGWGTGKCCGQVVFLHLEGSLWSCSRDLLISIADFFSMLTY